MTPRLDMIGLVCKDLEASLRFYKLLGMQIPDRQGDEPYLETTLAGGLRVSWNDLAMVKGIDPEWKEPVGQRIGLAFLCGSPADVDSMFSKLVAEGHPPHKEPWDAFWGQRYAQIQDPDGNVIDLFCPLT